MTSELVEELRALHVWPQSAADTWAEHMGPKHIAGLYSVGDVAHRAADHITTLTAQLAEGHAREAALRSELEWYGEQARLARLIHSEGDAGRQALAADGGKRACAVLNRSAPDA